MLQLLDVLIMVTFNDGQIYYFDLYFKNQLQTLTDIHIPKA